MRTKSAAVCFDWGAGGEGGGWEEGGGVVGSSREGVFEDRLVLAAHVAVPLAWDPFVPGYRPLQLQLCLTGQPSQAPAVAAAAAAAAVAAAAWTLQQRKKAGTWSACLPAVALTLWLEAHWQRRKKTLAVVLLQAAGFGQRCWKAARPRPQMMPVTQLGWLGKPTRQLRRTGAQAAEGAGAFAALAWGHWRASQEIEVWVLR